MALHAIATDGERSDASAAVERRRALTGRVIAAGAVDRHLSDQLYQLFAGHYLQTDRAVFDRDQREKDWVLLLSDADNIVRGFTTLKLYDLEMDGRPLRVVFSGNTIIERRYWGEQELVWTWCRFMARLKGERPALPLYWFVICSGYRTYLYLPLFYREFFPRYDSPTPLREQRMIDTLGRMKFAGEYQDGVVRGERPRECLQPGLAVPDSHKLRNPHVAFFLKKNPGYLAGDELVCITEFSLENTKRLAHRIACDVLLEATDAP
jgi:hypothetical protein